MKKRSRPNPRLAKIHRSYTVDETARLFSVHKGTVREWIKQGLPTTDQQRPALILGRHLRSFIEKQRGARKRPCAAGEMYCMRCKVPREPAGRMADWKSRGPELGDLVGICPVCETMMYRRVNLRNLAAVSGSLQLAFAEAPLRINERPYPSVNADFTTEAPDHANAQPE